MAANTTSALAKLYGQVAGDAAMRFAEAKENGEPWAVEAFAHWKETGEAPTVPIDKIEEVKSE